METICYENTPIQKKKKKKKKKIYIYIYEKFTTKNWKVLDKKKSDIFVFLLKIEIVGTS